MPWRRNFERAVDGGDIECMVRLGFWYTVGEGLEINYAKANDLFEQAADSGDVESMRLLGHL